MTEPSDGDAPIDQERRRHQRLPVRERGAVLIDGRLHPLVDCSVGGFFCLLPPESLPPVGQSVEVRLVLTADGSTVGDFDVSARIVRHTEPSGHVGARIVEVNGVAAHRFEAFLEECRSLKQ